MKKSLFIALLALIFIFLFVVSSEPALAGEWANSGQTCTKYCASTGGRLCIDTQNTVSDRITVGNSCSSSNLSLSCDRVYPYQSCCTCLDAPTLTPTSTPIPPTLILAQVLTNFNCGNQNCSSNQACVGTSFDNSTYCLTKGVGAIGSYCGSPNKASNNDACSSGYCNSSLLCATTAPVSKLVWQQIAVCPAPTSTPAPTSKPVPGDPISTSAPTPAQAARRGSPTLTPTPKLLLSITNVTTKLLGDGYVEATASLNKDFFDCLSMECSYKDGNSSSPVVVPTTCAFPSQRPTNAVVNSNFKPTQSNKWSLLSCKINTSPPSSKPLATYTNTSSLDTLTLTPTRSPAQSAQRGSPTPTPTQPPAGPAATTPNLFNCLDDPTGNYQCDTIIEGVMKCRSGYEDYSPPDPPYTGTSCGETRGCCKKKPSVSAPTITPTPAPVNNVTLFLTLNAQDIPVSPDPLPVSLVLYNLTTNDPVTGAPATQSFTKRAIPGKQYAANVSLSNLQKDTYFIVARKDNMIAKSLFTVTGETGNITVPTTTLVFGDVNNDNDIDALDYHLLRPCYKKTISSTPDCASSDFDKNGIIDQIDYNTLLRGWVTWNKEGKEIQ